MEAAAALDDRVEELHDCARYGELAEVSALLAAGVPADATDSDGRTALFFASANGHAAVVQLLLANGADARRAKGDGNTPLHWACLNGHADVAALLLAAGAAVTALNDAQRTPYDEALQSASQPTLDVLAAAAPPPGDDEDDVEEGDEPADGEALMPLD